MYVADREADVVALMRRARDLDAPADWLVRATHNRSVDDGEKLWEHTCSGVALGEISFTMPAREDQKARAAGRGSGLPFGVPGSGPPFGHGLMHRSP